MRHPLDAVRVGRRRRVFLPLFGLTLVVGAVLGWVDRPLRTDAAPNGIVSFEVAGDVTTARSMLDSWNESARTFAAFSLGFDYLFLVVYSTTIALGCLWAGEVFRGVVPSLAALARPLAWGQWLAALLDAVENAALTTLVLGTPAEPWPAIAWWCATPKFVLVGAGIAYALAAVGVRAVRTSEV